MAPNDKQLEIQGATIRTPFRFKHTMTYMSFIILPRKNILLGMDWLTVNKASIDCGERKVIFNDGIFKPNSKEEDKLNMESSNAKKETQEASRATETIQQALLDEKQLANFPAINQLNMLASDPKEERLTKCKLGTIQPFWLDLGERKVNLKNDPISMKSNEDNKLELSIRPKSLDFYKLDRINKHNKLRHEQQLEAVFQACTWNEEIPTGPTASTTPDSIHSPEPPVSWTDRYGENSLPFINLTINGQRKKHAETTAKVDELNRFLREVRMRRGCRELTESERLGDWSQSIPCSCGRCDLGPRQPPSLQLLALDSAVGQNIPTPFQGFVPTPVREFSEYYTPKDDEFLPVRSTKHRAKIKAGKESLNKVNIPIKNINIETTVSFEEVQRLFENNIIFFY